MCRACARLLARVQLVIAYAQHKLLQVAGLEMKEVERPAGGAGDKGKKGERSLPLSRTRNAGGGHARGAGSISQHVGNGRLRP